MTTTQEVDEFNLKRQAIQNTVTWEYEMWRRQTQAQWEIEQEQREIDFKQQLELQLLNKKTDQEDSKLKELLNTKQKQLQDILLKCQNEAKNLVKLKNQLQKEQENAQFEYGRVCQQIQLKFKQNRNNLLSKATAARARVQEMNQRARYFQEQWKSAEERLQADIAIMDERKRNALIQSEEDLQQQLNDLLKMDEEQLEQIQYLERCKQELYCQYERAIILEQKLKNNFNDSSNESESSNDS